ncbi:MAG TPA: energy transducer TonB [Steroidobacteraceae bacterium]|nr:energy transducer TonB [Steroidobacteraceae bacterium]
MKSLSAMTTAAVLLWTAAATAQVPVETYQAPKAIETKPASYPPNEIDKGEEGWVIVNMMIDREGKTYEATVVDSTGNRAFERAALAAVEKWSFEPARMNGTPIEAGRTFKLKFRLTDAEKGARPEFSRSYRQLLKAIEAGDRERADSRLALMRPHNLYEDGYYGVALYTYHRRWGTTAQQLSALRRAIADETEPNYLPKELFVSALQAQLSIEISTRDYARALETWATLRRNADAATLSRWEKSIGEIEALRTSDTAYAVTGEIATGTSWYYQLLKDRFQIDVTSGRLAEVKLRCNRQYVSFPFDPQLQYKISGNDRGCWMEVVGDPGTQFQLTQL